MDKKIRRKNMFLTDEIARKAFCVGGRVGNGIPLTRNSAEYRIMTRRRHVVA